MSALRSRKNGHREVTLGGFVLSVLFGSIAPALAAVLAMVPLSIYVAAVSTKGDTAADIITGSALIAAVAAGYAVIPVLLAGMVGLLFMRYGWAGWAVPVLIGGLLAGALGYIVANSPAFAAVGAAHGLSLWWGLVLFSPRALNDSPPGNAES